MQITKTEQTRILRARAKKQVFVSDRDAELGVMLSSVPVRIHAANGGYLFNVYQHPRSGSLYLLTDTRWTEGKPFPARLVKLRHC